MSGLGADAMLVEGDERVVLLVHIEVLNQPFLEEVGERPAVAENLLDVLVSDERPAVLDDDQRTADAPPIARDVHSALPGVGVDGHKLPQATSPPHRSQELHEVLGRAVEAEKKTVEEHQVHVPQRRLLPREDSEVLNTEIIAEKLDRKLVVISRDVRHERQVLDKAARFSLGRVSRAQHPPLRGLQGAGPADLSRLLELTLHAGDHSERRDVGEARENLRYSLALHPEPPEVPVARANSIDEGRSDLGGRKVLEDVESGGPRRFFQLLLRDFLHVAVEALEHIFEEKGHGLTSKLQPLVAVVILVVHHSLVVHCLDDAAKHQTDVDRLCSEIVLHHWHVRNHNCR
mmetsp:Transcript_44537/g.140517  ORF Transcript_44537/g.140517 Transcript_44537/m.140517 type:complete len:346 (+) Transcript_44537:1814-2851(+)